MLSEKRILDELPEREIKVSQVAKAVNSEPQLVLEVLRRLERKGCVTLRKPFLREHRAYKTGLAYKDESKVIAVLNLKGGVGKTITALNLAACLADLGNKTLLVDLDPQGNTTSTLKVKGKTTLYSVLVGNRNPEKAVHKTHYRNLHVIPSEIGLAGAEVEIVGVDAAYRLWEVLEWVKDEYRFIIIDCPPSLSMLSVNALTAADSVMVPVQCDQFAQQSLGKLLQAVAEVRSINERLHVGGVLLTMYDPKSHLSVMVAKSIEKKYGAMLYDTVIERDDLLGESVGFGVPIIHYSRESDAAQSYLELAAEVLGSGG